MRARFLLAVVLVSAAFTPGVTAEAEDEAALRPVLSDVQARYGSESWKDVNATIGQITAGSPLSAVPGPDETGVYQNPYSGPDHAHQGPAGNFLGYRLEGKITLRTGDGGAPPSDKNYVVDARIEAASGRIPARLAKVTNDTFQVMADLDGENAHDYPALTLGGEARLLVDVYEDPADPTVSPKVVASDRFLIDVRRGTHDAPTNLFPEAQAPGYMDVGATNYTDLRSGVVHPETRVEATVTFPGADGERAIARLHRGTTDNATVFTGRTGPNGTVDFSFTPSEVLPPTDDSGLLVLDTHLKGNRRVLGSAPLLLAVTPHPMTVSSVNYEDRSSAQGASTVQVTVQDSNENAQNNSRRGTLYLVKGTDVVAESSFGPGGTGDPTVRTARFPASAVQEPGFTSYSLVALFFDGQDDFYSLATAQRGASVSVETEPVEPNTETRMTVTVRNLNDNGNGKADTGLSLTAELEVRGLPGAAEVVQDQIIVDEGQVGTAEIPFTPTEAGNHDYAVNVTAGEIQMDLVGAVEVRDPSFFDEILSEDDLLGAPGPGGAALVAALAAAAVALRRRR